MDTNKQRRVRAVMALRDYRIRNNLMYEPIDVITSDLLTDLFHLFGSSGFDSKLAMAYMHYEAEKEEEA